MALGRVSPFQQLEDKAGRSGLLGENLPGSANASPFSTIEGDGGVGGGIQGDPGNANVTGFNAGLASLGIDAAAALAGGLPMGGAQIGSLVGGLPGMIASLAHSFGLGQARSAAIAGLPGNMVSQSGPTQGQSVNYSGPTSLLGLIGSLLSGNVPQVTTADPSPFGQANAAEIGLPSPSPNMGGYGGFGGGIPSTFAGSNTPGIFGDVTGLGSRGVSPTAPGRQAGVAPGNQNVPNQFGARPNPPDPTPDSNAEPSDNPDAVTATVSADPTSAGPVSGDAPGSGGLGEGSGASGPGGDAAWHGGGFVDLEQDNQGPFGENASNDRNSPDEGTKEVDATLQDGEFVVNKEAAGRFGPLLNQLNNLGRNQQLRDVLRTILEGAAKVGLDSLKR